MSDQELFLVRIVAWAQTLDQARRSGIEAWIEQAQEQHDAAMQDSQQAGFPVQ